MTSYFRSLVKSGTLDSSKSFALLLSVIIGAIIGLVVCFCLIWDVVTNGYIKTNLNELGVFLLCAGGFMVGGGHHTPSVSVDVSPVSLPSIV